jgi:hypothetical protein
MRNSFGMRINFWKQGIVDNSTLERNSARHHRARNRLCPQLRKSGFLYDKPAFGMTSFESSWASRTMNYQEIRQPRIRQHRGIVTPFAKSRSPRT